MMVCWSVVLPLLLAVGAAGNHNTRTTADSELAGLVIRNMLKMYDDPSDTTPAMQRFINALEKYTEQVVYNAVDHALARWRELFANDGYEEVEEVIPWSLTETMQVDHPHLLHVTDNQRQLAEQNYLEALDHYREIKIKLVLAQDWEDQAWLLNEKAKTAFKEIRDYYSSIGVTNPLGKEDYNKALQKWDFTHRHQLKALESLEDVRKVFLGARERYMLASKQHSLAQQRYAETRERYPQVYDSYPQREGNRLEHEQASGVRSRNKNTDSSSGHEISPVGGDPLQKLFYSEQDSRSRSPHSPIATPLNVPRQGFVEDELVKEEEVEAHIFGDEKEMSGSSKSRRRRQLGWELLSLLGPINAGFSLINNARSIDFSILDSLFEVDTPVALLCPPSGMQLMRCVGDHFFDRVVKAPIETLGGWLSDLFVPEFYL